MWSLTSHFQLKYHGLLPPCVKLEELYLVDGFIGIFNAFISYILDSISSGTLNHLTIELSDPCQAGRGNVGSSRRGVSPFAEKTGNLWSTDGGVINAVVYRRDERPPIVFSRSGPVICGASRSSKPLIA